MKNVYIETINCIYGIDCFSFLKHESQPYGSTIYVRNNEIRTKLMKNQVETTNEYGITRKKTDYFTITNKPILGLIEYYTTVSSNYR